MTATSAIAIEVAEPQGESLEALETPCLIVDGPIYDRNVARMKDRAKALGVMLRPHLKTTKSTELAAELTVGPDHAATVSTLKEARIFAGAGFNDLIYAVGIAPGKLPDVIELIRGGCDLKLVLDSVAQAEEVAAASRAGNVAIPALIEIDCDGHRSGVAPGDAETLLAIARTLCDGGADFRGVLTHAGESYAALGKDAQRRAAEEERDAVVIAAALLADADFPCRIVSVGSTPTSLAATDLTGVTELRAGVYSFFDLVMAGIGACTIDDIALSVLSTVIGHQKDKGWILIDAGWMAMSRDRGTSKLPVDQGYGLVCDAEGRPYEDLVLISANQEHGVVAIRPGSAAALPELEIGDLVRILPNHACSTAAQHDRYHFVDGGDGQVTRTVSRFMGW
ncbi:DSD1 family PLP-dependent enzyme [Pseudooceanicola sp. 216_PA32_1]|uniref:DSD1 family PLP-dependent enzyme n=1 Tax=Pseudooceanicola pacificus TaxID=2676438 RepID=A0A844WER3_9RHOB|nr:alanine racemase [Pseudooceanicola pacificus]MWB77619.1 DSD1 family PLP-dependent enzyme [Pseudooceanicola pacificus]